MNKSTIPLPHRRTARPALLASLGTAFVLAACQGEGASHRTIDTQRTLKPEGTELKLHATTAERFRFSAVTDARPTGGGLDWTTPPNWSELPSTTMRQANFLVAGDELAECYLTVLSGDGGGLEANANRWRGQMGLPDASAAEIQALPRIEFFGGDGLYLDVEGAYAGMGDAPGAEGHRLVGVCLVDATGAMFLKMVGPKSVIDPEVEAFRALAASFHNDGAGGHAAHGGADDHAAHVAAPTGVASNAGGGLTWDPPPGWKRGPEKSMRAVTWFVGEGGAAECYVTILSGTGGGDLANVNRWRSQMGQSELSSAEFGDLERFPMLGGTGIVVEITGSYTGMGDVLVEDACLLGALFLLPDRAVFVKMTGPGSLVRGERGAFLDFCRSLQPTG